MDVTWDEWTCGVSLPSHSRHDVWYDTWCFPYEQTKLFLHPLSAPVLIINQSPPHKNASVLTRADNTCPVNDTCTSAGWGLHRSLAHSTPDRSQVLVLGSGWALTLTWQLNCSSSFTVIVCHYLINSSSSSKTVPDSKSPPDIAYFPNPSHSFCPLLLLIDWPYTCGKAKGFNRS